MTYIAHNYWEIQFLVEKAETNFEARFFFFGFLVLITRLYLDFRKFWWKKNLKICRFSHNFYYVLFSFSFP